MGFFSDLKEDLSQAVNELMPEEELNAKLAGNAEETAGGPKATEEKTGSLSAENADMAQEVFSEEKTAEPGNLLDSVDLGSMLDKLEAEQMGKAEPEPFTEELADQPEPATGESELQNEDELVPEPLAEEMTGPEAIHEPIEEAAAEAVMESPVEAETEAVMESPVETAAEAVAESPVETETFAEAGMAEAENNIVEDTAVAGEMQEQAEETKMETENQVMENSKGDEKKVELQAKEAVDETAVVTAGMSITGDILSEGSLELIGTVNGNIDVLGKVNITGCIQGNSKAAEIYAEGAKITGEINSQGSVKIGQSSVVIGNITATSAVIAGAVKGDIDVHGPVILDTSAIVMGNIKSKSVQINNGAVIEGMCSQCYADVNPTSFFEDFKKKK